MPTEAAISKLLQDRAILYASGAMSARERADFELVLEFRDEVRQLVSELQEVGTAILLSDLPATWPTPPLDAKVLRALVSRSQQTTPESFVMTGPDRLVQWVNPAFVTMCGYSLEELRGKNLGPIVQGEKTDRAAVARMRRAVRELRPCRETVVNYRKDGSPYEVDIAITPILDDQGAPLWFVARERELAA